jgi:predicted ester cyclase
VADRRAGRLCGRALENQRDAYGPPHGSSGIAIPPTGKSVVLTGSSTSEVKNGKIVCSWTFWDLSSLFGQLGLLPPM